MSYQKLRSIEVKGYKSIQDQRIPLENLNILIGQNGAGKTNFISLFRFLRNIISGRLKNISQTTGAEVLLYYGSKVTSNITISLDFDPNYYKIRLQPASNKDTLIVESEHTGFRGTSYSTPYWDSIASSEEESQLAKKAKTNKIADYVLQVLKEWRVYHFHDTSESAGMKKYASMADNKFLLEDASNIAPFLFVLRHKNEEYYERIVKTVQLVIPFFRDFILEPNPLNSEKIRLEWMDIFSDKTFTANELSDGSLRFICIATLLLQEDLPKIILLDEPELGLHPSAITILSGLLKKASKRTQVIVSTQSVSLVNEFDAEDIIVVEKEKSETVFRRLHAANLESWLEEYSMGDLWDKNIIGGKP
jgi:predicted ATPase